MSFVNFFVNHLVCNLNFTLDNFLRGEGPGAMSKSDYRKTKTRLIGELDALRRRVAELQGEPVWSESDERYRRLVQLMPDTVGVSCDGRVV